MHRAITKGLWLLPKVGLNLPVFLKGVNSEYIPKRTIQTYAVGQSSHADIPYFSKGDAEIGFLGF